MAVEKSVQVKVPGYSGFDKSHRCTTTLKCGQITPVLVDELIPGSRVNLKLDLSAQLPPLVSDTFMNVKLRAEAFFCPSRILCKSFESFYSDFPQDIIYSGADTPSPTAAHRHRVKGVVPKFYFSYSGWNQLLNDGLVGPGTLADFLGLNPLEFTQQTSGFTFNILPFLAYHMIYQEWYRNPRVQVAPFTEDYDKQDDMAHVFAAPFTFYHSLDIEQGQSSFQANDIYSTSNRGSLLADNVSFFSLRQRNFGLDYFTSAQLTAQQGDPVFVRPASESSDGSFSIAALRAMNSLQQFKERNNIPSPRMIDQTRARYGVEMSDGVAQRPLCLGSAEYDVYSKGVDQTAVTDTSSANPFNSVGAQYGRAYASGSDFIIDNFECKEPGYLFVMVTLVPSVSYGYGISPLVTRYVAEGSITDMANPILQNVGNEPIFGNELCRTATSTNYVFGYRERYGSWKDIPSRVHSKMLDGQDLESFVLQRSIASSTSSMSSSFLQIPENYMDQVFVADSSTMGFACWFDAYFSYKVSMPLAKYSIPSLQDPAYEHGRTISLRKNGQIF